MNTFNAILKYICGQFGVTSPRMSEAQTVEMEDDSAKQNEPKEDRPSETKGPGIYNE